MRRVLLKSLRDVVAITLMIVVAAAVAGYILENQRMRFPVIEDKPFKLKAELITAQAVTPGQGQTVRVSGIRVGDIAKTELKDGRAVVTMDLDREYEDLVHTDATALLRPKTGLKDMFIELNPGTPNAPLAKEGFTLPVHNTLPDVNPDEFLSALDQDTRDYLKLLLHGAGKGLRGRGDDLGEVLARFEPTYRDLGAVTTEVAKRRKELRLLINSLARLNQELGSKDDELAELVDSSAQVFRAFASERRNVTATVRELPSALRETEIGLERVRRMARILGPASEALRPVAHALRRANVATQPFTREAAPLLRDDIRPFVREARPLVDDLKPAVGDLVEAEPGLTRSFHVLNRLFNMLGHNPRGREGPDVAGRDEGYLFSFGWLGHQSANLFSNADAHGPQRATTTGGTCTTLAGTLETLRSEDEDALTNTFLDGLSGVLTDPRVCGGVLDGEGRR
jgi:phospholipid/cholesterol/gamma-HCH transport system substrate-binding protein